MADNLIFKKPSTLRQFIEWGFAIWAICAVLAGLLGYQKGYSIGYELFSDLYRYLITVAFSFILMILSYAYILAEPKNGHVLRFGSRFFIGLGIIFWFFVALCTFTSGYGASSDLTLRFAGIAHLYPLTTLFAYCLINTFGHGSYWKSIFSVLCVALPIVHFIIGISLAR